MPTGHSNYFCSGRIRRVGIAIIERDAKKLSSVGRVRSGGLRSGHYSRPLQPLFECEHGGPPCQRSRAMRARDDNGTGEGSLGASEGVIGGRSRVDGGWLWGAGGLSFVVLDSARWRGGGVGCEWTFAPFEGPAWLIPDRVLVRFVTPSSSPVHSLPSSPAQCSTPLPSHISTEYSVQ